MPQKTGRQAIFLPTTNQAAEISQTDQAHQELNKLTELVYGHLLVLNNLANTQRQQIKAQNERIEALEIELEVYRGLLPERNQILEARPVQPVSPTVNQSQPAQVPQPPICQPSLPSPSPPDQMLLPKSFRGPIKQRLPRPMMESSDDGVPPKKPHRSSDHRPKDQGSVYRCKNACGYFAAKLERVQKHERNHCNLRRNEEKQSVKTRSCEICGATFTYEGLRSHLRNFYKNGLPRNQLHRAVSKEAHDELLKNLKP